MKAQTMLPSSGLGCSSLKPSRRSRRAIPALLAALSGAMCFAQQPPSQRVSNVAAEFARLPLSFEANLGQSDPRVRFISRGQGYSIFLTDSGAVLSLSKQAGTAKPGQGKAPDLKTDVVRMELTNASLAHPVTGENKLSGKVNYFIGSDSAKWHSDVPTYGKVRYANAYPGVDLVYYGNQQKLECDFVVAPNADPKPVKLHFAGVTKLSLDSDGDLNVAASNGKLVFHKPVVYQIRDGKRTPVEGRFQLLANNDLGFTLGRYDHNQELVIDPVLGYSTYLGGTSSESANGIAVDATGHAYVTGETSSTDFPVTAGAFEPVKPATAVSQVPIVFVTKFNQSASGLIYSTFLGGNGGDTGYSLAIDSKGDAFICGTTYSSNFPVTSGAYENTLANSGGSFITKLGPSGNTLVYSTYLNGADHTMGIAVDTAGEAYVTGYTRSTSLAVSASAFQKTNLGDANAFVVKVNAAGTAALYSTYLGGKYFDMGSAIAVDGSDHAYVTGSAYSSNFPHTGGAYQSVNKGAPLGLDNVFVTKLNAAGSALAYSTFLGGTGGDSGLGIALDSEGEAYVVGNTYSSDFPHTSGAYQAANNGAGNQADNAFVSKLNSAGAQLVYSTYLGGTGVLNLTDDDGPNSFGDTANTIAVDSAGNAYVGGAAVSGDFPVTGDAYQAQTPSQEANVDGDNPVGFFTTLNPQGSGLIYSTFLGGSGCGYGIGYAGIDGLGDSVNAIGLDSFGNAYVAGTTCSGDFPVTSGAFQSANKSTLPLGTTSFVSKFGTPSETKMTLDSSVNPQQLGANVTFTAHVEPVSGNGVCTGKVYFTIAGTESMISATVAINNTGVATYSTNALGAGQQFVDAEYLGDSNCLTTSATLTETIVATTTTSISSSPTQSTKGEAVTFTAIVSAASKSGPSGTVNFMNGNTSIGTGTLTPTINGTHTVGMATLTTTKLPVGTLKITAAYEGSSLDDPSTSPQLTIVVSQ
jgi:Bacterial Ig-like domain (group 3)/Beta-propeller repeat